MRYFATLSLEPETKIIMFFTNRTPIYIGIIVLFLFSGCAQMMQLSGGEKDVMPPKVTAQYPSNKTVNFSGDEIRIDFDEIIQLRDIQNQLIITPRLAKDPEVTANGKTLRLKFKESLQPNTTYNVNFGSAVSDIHEGNILSSLAVVFSTGKLLDSLSISGKITDAFTLKPANDASVFLYVNGDDSSMFTRKPDYFARADKDGNYNIDFIKEGDYKIIAIGDKNKNFLYEQGEEFIAPVSPENKGRKFISKNEIFNFRLYKEEPSNFYLKKTSYPFFGKVVYVFNKPLKDGGVEIKIKKEEPELDPDSNRDWNFNKQKDSLTVYYFKGVQDTVTIFLLQKQKVIDTLYMYAQSNDKYESDLKAKKLNPVITGVLQNKKEGGLQVFTSGRIDIFDPGGKILMVVNKDTLRVKNPVKPNNDYFVIENDFSKAVKGTLIFLPGILNDYSGLRNDTIRKEFEIKTKEDFSTLILNITPPPVEGSYFLEVINEKGGTFGEKIKMTSAGNSKSEKITLDWMPPGNYSLRLTKDDNDDLEWTGGNFMKGIPPEKIYFYNKPIKLLPDWEINVEWKVED